MSDETRVSFLINNADNIFALESLRQQSFTNWECFLINNSIKNIDKYIENDSRFHISKSSINDTIKQINGEYVCILNCDDVLVSNALSNINRAIYLSNADIINVAYENVKNLYSDKTYKTQFDFNFIFQKNQIYEHVFDYMSGFYIKSDIIKKSQYNDFAHIWIMNILEMVDNMYVSQQPYILLQHNYTIFYNTKQYREIVDYYTRNNQDYNFWKNYFAHIIPFLIQDTIKNNDRDTFIYCTKKIPRKLIPLKYRFLFFIMKTFN